MIAPSLVALALSLAAAPAAAEQPAAAPPPGTAAAAPELAPLRREIDAIDAQLLALLSRRAQLAQEVAAVKRARGLPVRVPERERQVVAALQAASRGPLAPEAIARIWERIFEEMRAIEAGAPAP